MLKEIEEKTGKSVLSLKNAIQLKKKESKKLI